MKYWMKEVLYNTTNKDEIQSELLKLDYLFRRWRWNCRCSQYLAILADEYKDKFPLSCFLHGEMIKETLYCSADMFAEVIPKKILDILNSNSLELDPWVRRVLFFTVLQEKGWCGACCYETGKLFAVQSISGCSIMRFWLACSYLTDVYIYWGFYSS